MDFVTAVQTCVVQKYADFNGRASRSEYWWYYLAYILAYTTVAVIDAILGIGGILSGLLGLVLLLPSLGVGVRRLHDLDRSGWWMLVALVPLVGALLLLYWYVQEGTRGDNMYGTNPPA